MGKQGLRLAREELLLLDPSYSAKAHPNMKRDPHCSVFSCLTEIGQMVSNFTAIFSLIDDAPTLTYFT